MTGDGSRNVRIRFWGVRGSLPAPLLPSQLRTKFVVNQNLPPGEPEPHAMTHGGNTTCIEVRCDGVPLILDMGTGLRLLGEKLMPQVIARHGFEAVVLQSHLHLDHIIGFPFFAPIFLKQRDAEIRLTLLGGANGGMSTSDGLRHHMRHPFFPVNLTELERTTLRLTDVMVCDGFEYEIRGTHAPIQVLAWRVHHPDETYGYRITFNGRSIAFTTDHEPYGGGGVPKGLLELVKNADLWITDCQYSHAQYLGDEDGRERFNWGHSFPEYIAEVAKRAGPKRIITMHHDPNADDYRITNLAKSIETLSGCRCSAAAEEMEIVL